MRTLKDKVIQPMLSEKVSQKEMSFNEYALLVDESLTKPEIKKAVKDIFGIEALKVRTVNFRKKTKRTRHGIVAAKAYKKALIRLPEGKRLELK